MSRIKGMAELDKALSGLQKASRGRVLRRAAMAAALPVVRAARVNIPKGRKGHKTYKGRYVAPGFSSRSIRRRSYMDREKTRVSVDIGVSKEAFYAALFVELGTRKMPKRPWLRPALRDNQNAVTDILAKKLLEGIEAEHRKALGASK